MKRKIVLYTSSTCAKCKIIKPQIEEFLKDKNDIEYVLINVDKKNGFNLALENEVYSLPTLFYFEDDILKKKLVSNFTFENVKELIGA